MTGAYSPGAAASVPAAGSGPHRAGGAAGGGGTGICAAGGATGAAAGASSRRGGADFADGALAAEGLLSDFFLAGSLLLPNSEKNTRAARSPGDERVETTGSLYHRCSKQGNAATPARP